MLHSIFFHLVMRNRIELLNELVKQIEEQIKIAKQTADLADKIQMERLKSLIIRIRDQITSLI